MEEKQIQPTMYERLLKKEWTYTTGAVLITALSLCLAAFSGTWGVSGPLSTWGAKFFSIFGIKPETWNVSSASLESYRFFSHQASITDIGLVIGSLIACLLAAQWKIRNIKHYKQALAAIIGGLLMGFGAKIANGCNVGALFSQLPQFSGAAWVFLLFVFLGATVGGKLLKYFMPPVSNKRPVRKKTTAEQRARNRKIQIGVGAGLVVLMIIVAVAVSGKYPKAPAIMFVGLGLGYVMQRSRFCFTAAYRDPALTGETKVTKAVIIAFALSTIGFFGTHSAKYGVDLSSLESLPGNPIHLQMIIGSFLFGIGAVLAGGCASGTFIRIGEGYVQNLIALPFFILGNLIGGPVSKALSGTFFQAGKKIYLPAVFGGMMPALIIQLLALLGLWILADWWEKKKRGAAN